MTDLFETYLNRSEACRYNGHQHGFGQLYVAGRRPNGEAAMNIVPFEFLPEEAAEQRFDVTFDRLINSKDTDTEASLPTLSDATCVAVALSQWCSNRQEGSIHGRERLASILVGDSSSVKSIYDVNVKPGLLPGGAHGHARLKTSGYAAALSPSCNITFSSLPMTFAEEQNVTGVLPVFSVSHSSHLGSKQQTLYMALHGSLERPLEFIIDPAKLVVSKIGRFLR